MGNLQVNSRKLIKPRTKFGSTLRTLRIEKKLNHEQLAKLLTDEGVEISSGVISQWERGACRPRANNMAALQKVLPGLKKPRRVTKNRRGKFANPQQLVLNGFSDEVRKLEEEYKTKREELVQTKKKQLEEELRALNEYIEGS